MLRKMKPKSTGKSIQKLIKKGFGKWIDDFDKMALKTAVKLHLNSGEAPLSIEMQKAVIADQSVIKNPETMEVEYVDNMPQTIEMKQIEAERSSLIDFINKADLEGLEILEIEIDQSDDELVLIFQEKKKELLEIQLKDQENGKRQKIKSNILFRCSRLGELMTGVTSLTTKQKEMYIQYSERNAGAGKPLTENQLIDYGKLLEKKNNTEIGDTAKSFVLDTFLQNEFGYKDVVTNDAMMKGLLLESDAIALVSKFENKFYKKNKERKSNNWIMGELDVKAIDHIKDIKVSKDLKTFAKVTEVKKQYYYQALGYMWLWNIPKYSLTYVLLPNTEEMIERQCSRLSFN